MDCCLTIPGGAILWATLSTALFVAVLQFMSDAVTRRSLRKLQGILRPSVELRRTNSSSRTLIPDPKTLMDTNFNNFDFSQGALCRLLEDEHKSFPHSYFSFEGTVRACSPEYTFARLKPHLSSMGITRIAHVGGLDTIGLPVAICYRPNSRHLSSGQGKGYSRPFAEVSAVMECVEGFHIEQFKEPALHGTYDELKGSYRLVDPTTLSSGYFSNRDLRQRRLNWRAATNLLNGQTVLVPACLARIDFADCCPETNLLSITSNGLASGNLLSEAICHAILEIIERDCLATWERSAQSNRNNTRIDLDTITSPTIREMIAHFRQADCELALWDISNELQVPSINCGALSTLGYHGGSGAHHIKDIAVLRALAETAQARAVWISGSRDDLYPDRYLRQLERKPINAHPRGSYDYSRVRCLDRPRSFSETLELLCSILQVHGHDEILAINHTTPHFNIPVVQVFIPGMAIDHDR